MIVIFVISFLFHWIHNLEPIPQIFASLEQGFEEDQKNEVKASSHSNVVYFKTSCTLTEDFYNFVKK
jgi:hypothetical protein